MTDHLITYLPHECNPPKGSAHIHSFGPLATFRGNKVTRVSDEVLAKLRETPTFQQWEKWGAARINSVGANSQANQEQLAEDVAKDLKASEVIEKVSLIDDIDTLKSLAKTDSRKTVQDAITRRIKEVKEENEHLLS